MLLGLRSVGYEVEHLDAAAAWYAALLGYPPYFTSPAYVGFDVGGFELGLHVAGPGRRAGAGGATVYWGVLDLREALRFIEGMGAQVLQAPIRVGEDVRVATLKDPFGNLLGLIENPGWGLRADQAGGSAALGPIAANDRGGRLASAGDLSERAIVRWADLPAAPEALWALWATEQGLKRWLVSSCRVEARIGGPYELYFQPDAPEGQRGGEGCRVLSFLPGRMLSFTWNAPPHLARTRDQRTWVVLELAPAEGGARLTLTHTGWPERAWSAPGSQWPETFAYFEAAWSRVLEALAAHLGGV